MKEKTVFIQSTVKIWRDDDVLIDEVTDFEDDIATELRVNQSRWGSSGRMNAKSVDVRVIRSSQPNATADRPAATAGTVRPDVGALSERM